MRKQKKGAVAVRIISLEEEGSPWKGEEDLSPQQRLEMVEQLREWGMKYLEIFRGRPKRLRRVLRITQQA